MSEEEVELARETWRVFGERGIDGVLDYFAEDCVSEDTPQTPDRAISVTRDEGYVGTLRRELGGRGAAAGGVHRCGGGRRRGDLHARAGKGSGTPVDALIAFANEFSVDGKIIRQRAFFSRSEALEAVGLSE